MKLEWSLIGISLIVLTSCASDPAQQDPILGEHFDKIQVLDTNDGNLSCGDIKGQVTSLEDSIKKLDYQQQYWKQQQGQASQMSAMGAALGNSYIVAGNQISGQTASDKVTDIEATESTYQKRHDYLLQIYLTKKCTPNS